VAEESAHPARKVVVIYCQVLRFPIGTLPWLLLPANPAQAILFLKQAVVIFG